jgi:diguanylate cyclase (GGDEF)-like protein
MADGKRVQITVSAGVANWSKELDSDTLLRSADQMLYRAKEAGRNRVELAEQAVEPVAKRA